MTSAALADLDQPMVAGWKRPPRQGRPGQGPAADGQGPATMYTPTQVARPEPSGEGRVPVQPQRSDHRKSAKWERKTDQGSEEGRSARVHRPGAVEDDAGDVLRRDQHPGRFGGQGGRDLLSCCVPTEESAGQKKPSPPLVVLHWGSISSFPAFVTSVSAKFTLFRSDGTPIRAVCSVQHGGDAGRGVPQAEPDLRQPRGPPGCTARRRRQPGLGGVREYGDPTAWRALAAFNEIDDPLRVPTGTVAAAAPPRNSPRRWPVPDEHHQHLPGRDRRQAAARRHRAAAGVRVRGRQPATPGHVPAALPRSQPDGAVERPGPRSARWSRSACRSPGPPSPSR